MLKKKVSFLTALVMLLTLLVGGVPAVQAKEGFVASGYTIIDSAYGNGTYVVMAKNLTDTKNYPTKIYSSANGKNWTETLSVANGTKWGSPASKQNLLWWEKEKVFVASVGDGNYVSANGTSWEKNSVLSDGMSYALIDERDGVLAMVKGDNGNIKFASSLTSATEPVSISGSTNQFGSFGAGPVVNGNNSYWAMNRYQYFKTTLPDATANWTGDRGTNSKDAKYVSSYNGWMILYTGSSKIETMNYKGDMETINVIAGGETVTSNFSAIGSDNSVLAVGTVGGNIYTMTAPASRPSGNTTWQSAVPADGTTAISEEVTDITAIGNNEFFVTTATGVYNMKKTDDGYVYSDMLAYKTIEEAKLIGTLPFDGVTILGGAYSPKLDIHVVYGNDANKKGYIFYSEDGINWNTTAVGTQTLTWGFEAKAKNVAVWWPAKEMFVISAATDWKDADNKPIGATQTCWYSKDGKSWSWMNKNGFGDNGDISVMGDYLYTSYKGSNWAIRRFGALDGVVTNIFYTVQNSNTQACTTMAVSDDEVPVVLVGAGYGQTFVNKATLDRNAVTLATLITPGGTGASSQMRDVHWNTNIDKFVGVNSANSSVYLIDADANVESFVPNSESGILAAIETNNSSYLTGGANGTIYYSAGANISTASTFTEVQTAGTKNTLPVTNIFVGKDNKYFVTVSDGTESDILVVAADGSGYQKVSEMVTPTSISAGDTFKISVKTTNYTNQAENITLIAAIYDSTGTTLLQVTSEGKTMQLNTSEVLTMDVTAGSNVTSDCKVKVFIWDSINGMTPVAGETKSFF